MNYKVSIIIPTYKGENYLARTLQTVLNQSYAFLEIIVVDDNGRGSFHQKKTEKIINNLNDNRIKYLVHDKNINGAAARNTGLKQSKGEYICFLDDDDLLLKNRIKNAVNFLKANKEYDAVFSDVACCDEKLNITKVIEVTKSGNCLKNILLDDMFFGTGSNIFITRRAFNEIGYFNENFVRHQDLEYMIRFYKKFKSGVINKIDIIKSKNGINNIPSYEKLHKNELLYNLTFKEEISYLNEEEKKIFFNNQNTLLRVSKICSTKISIANIKEFIKLSMKNKILVIVTKTRIINTKIFKYVNSKIKKRKYNKNKPRLPEYLIKFVESYKEEL